jgi:hypothetical protein
MGLGVVIPQPQHGERQPLGSKPPSFHAASAGVKSQSRTNHDVRKNPFLSNKEKALPTIRIQHDIHQSHMPPQIHIQPSSIASQNGQPGHPSIVDVNESHRKLLPQIVPPRGEKELLAMEEELDNLEQEREKLEKVRGRGWRDTFGTQVEGEGRGRGV